MRKRAWLLGTVVLAAVLLGIWYVARPPRLGPLEATPAGGQVSVRVGERLRFVASAPGATGFTWLRWGRPVSFDPAWAYVPGPEDAGWQQVTLEVRGRRGLRLTRTWDVGVVMAVAPDIETLEPPAGFVSLPAGDKWTFRARAHLPAAREGDRLAFEWLLDDRPVLREEREGDEGSSELVIPPAEPGSHRLRLRVTEDGRTASLADWAIDATPGAPPTQIARVPSPPPVAPSTTTLPSAPASPAAPTFVRMPGPRILETGVGEPVRLEARVEPAAAQASYRWTVDGKPIAESSGRLEFAPSAPGPHVLEVTVGAGERTLGRDSWVVTALAPEPPAATPRPHIVRLPAVAEVPSDVATALAFEVRVEPTPEGDVGYHWSVDGKTIVRRGASRLEYRPETPGRHRLVVAVESDGATLGRATWIVAARGEERAAPPERAVSGEPARPPAVAAVAPPARSATALAEADVRRWLDDYARAWSQKDLGALRRMGQVRSAAEAAQLQRYFTSIESLDVEVHVTALTVEGERASVEFERTDTVTDPSGRRQQLRLPPMRKEIERTPEGLRFTGGGAG